MPEHSIEAVQEAHTRAWMAVPGVVGTGIGRCEGEPCIKVFVSARSDRVEAAIPSEVEGYPVQIEVTGAFQARDTTED
ncbi:MAG: hypothetical protein R3324_07375 [Halobacteriales archaeon]|nr:hypothetical protein [Halobacteriales archaeon]